MTGDSSDVKADRAGNSRRPVVVYVIWARCRSFIDRHPRTGWWLTFWLAVNFIVDALQTLF